MLIIIDYNTTYFRGSYYANIINCSITAKFSQLFMAIVIKQTN